MERVEEKEQQLLGVVLRLVVELGQDGVEHGCGLHWSTTGAPAGPHLLQQAHKSLGHLAVRPAHTEMEPLGEGRDLSPCCGGLLLCVYFASSLLVS